MLGRLSVLLMDDDFRKNLLAAGSADEFLRIIDRAEQEKFAEEDTPRQPQSPARSGYQVLAVTACPTGIAHTYMAAESLEATAGEMGISIKVETNGSGGVKNRLTAEEIAACDCIIVAADKQVETARFAGKPVIFTKVANGINKAHELLEDAVSGKASVYHGGSEGDVPSEKTAEKKKASGAESTKHLMNGVSHMLPVCHRRRHPDRPGVPV